MFQAPDDLLGKRYVLDLGSSKTEPTEKKSIFSLAVSMHY